MAGQERKGSGAGTGVTGKGAAAENRLNARGSGTFAGCAFITQSQPKRRTGCASRGCVGRCGTEAEILEFGASATPQAGVGFGKSAVVVVVVMGTDID